MWTVKINDTRPYYFQYHEPKDYWAWSKFWKNAPTKPDFEMLGFIKQMNIYVKVGTRPKKFLMVTNAPRENVVRALEEAIRLLARNCEIPEAAHERSLTNILRRDLSILNSNSDEIEQTINDVVISVARDNNNISYSIDERENKLSEQTNQKSPIVKGIERYNDAKGNLLNKVQASENYLVFLNGKFEGLKQGSDIISDLDKNKAKYFDQEKTVLQLIPAPGMIHLNI